MCLSKIKPKKKKKTGGMHLSDYLVLWSSNIVVIHFTAYDFGKC